MEMTEEEARRQSSAAFGEAIRELVSKRIRFYPDHSGGEALIVWGANGRWMLTEGDPPDFRPWLYLHTEECGEYCPIGDPDFYLPCDSCILDCAAFVPESPQKIAEEILRAWPDGRSQNGDAL